MAEKIKLHDFVEIDYTGKLTDGTIFDTTEEKIAQEHGLFNEQAKVGSATICVGEQQILPGLEQSLIDKEVGDSFTVILSPEKAFGKREVKNIKIIPLSTFREHNTQPQPGLQIDVDGRMGTVTSVSGGRVIVNFNHPLAGKEVVYDVKINKKVTDRAEQIISFLNTALRIPKDKIKVEIKENLAEVKLPLELPDSLFKSIGDKLAELTGLKEVSLSKSDASNPGQVNNPSVS